MHQNNGQRPKSADIRGSHLELMQALASCFHCSVVSCAPRPNVAACVSMSSIPNKERGGGAVFVTGTIYRLPTIIRLGQEELVTGKEHISHAVKPTGRLLLVRTPSDVVTERTPMCRRCSET